MTDQIIEAPPLRAFPPRERGAAGDRRARVIGPLWTARWVIGVVLVVLAALGVVLWAQTRPGYDPYGWLVWGHLTLHGKLDTNGAPSWKPLPFLFTVPYALIGHRALWLWMVTSVAFSLSGFVFAARIGYFLTAPPKGKWWAGVIAGVLAAALLLGIDYYTHYILSSQSDTMIVSLCLGAIDCHLNRRYRWAFTLLVLAALGRPETWAPLILYAIWAWRAVPSMRPGLAVGVVLQPLLWFGIPGLTSKSWFTAGNIALKSPRALHGNKLTGEIDRFFDLDETQVYLAALLTVAIAAIRRDRATLLIAASAVLWIVVEIAFVLHGWPGVPRYLFEAGGVMTVLAGAAAGRLLVDLPALARRFAPRSRVPSALATVLALAIVAAVTVSLVPAARTQVKIERADLTVQRARTRSLNHLSGLIARLGGPKRLFACGQPTTQIGLQSVLAWDLGVNTGELFWTPHLGKTQPRPVVLFEPTPHAWKVKTINIPPDRQAACRGLNVVSLLSSA